jgi:hypothetical protein
LGLHFPTNPTNNQRTASNKQQEAYQDLADPSPGLFENKQEQMLSAARSRAHGGLYVQSPHAYGSGGIRYNPHDDRPCTHRLYKRPQWVFRVGSLYKL